LIISYNKIEFFYKNILRNKQTFKLKNNNNLDKKITITNNFIKKKELC